MNLNQLKYFKVLAQTEHCTRASESLFITQPTLTHAIKELEKELNVCLFNKEGRNIKLSNCGKAYYNYVDKALTLLEKGKDEIQSLTSSCSGTIKLGFLPSLSQKDIPLLLRRFEQKTSSNIQFKLFEGNTAELTYKLLSRKIDFAFSSQISDWNVTSIPILEQDLYLITAQCHPTAKYQHINPKDLEKDPFIIYKKESGMRPIVENILRKLDIHPQISFQLISDEAICGFVSSNLGIAIVPKIYGIDQYQIVLHKIPKKLYQRYIYFSYLSDSGPIKPSMELFKNYIKSYQKHKTTVTEKISII